MARRWSLRWSLRYRLIAVVVVLLAAMGTAIGVASTVALRGSLLTQLDVRLADAQMRGVHGLEGNPPNIGLGTPSDAPAGLEVRGQGAGTVVAEQLGNFWRGAYIADDGTTAYLPEEQAYELFAVPADGVERTIEIDDMGRYRVVAAVRGDVLTVTGLPMAEYEDAVTRHILTTLVITLAGLVLVGVAGSFLIRRELRQLDRVAATASRVAHLPLHRGEVQLGDRVPDADTDQRTEVGKVGAALNQLLGHVESALGARQASEVKLRRFVADASHELRTPLASIRGYAELARRIPEEVPPDIVRALGRVESEAVRMTQLVEDLLLLARLDAGRELDRSPVDLTALAADAVADAHAAGPDHVWRLELPGQAECADGDPEDCELEDCEAHPGSVLVTGDDHAVRQVLANLLTNARVHTPAGTIVTTIVEARDDAVVLTVTDTGPGIAPELLERIFDRFSRGDAARSPGTGSTGLGLSIANAVVRAHHGRIDVDGTPGATTFTVTFPGPAQDRDQSRGQDPEQGRDQYPEQGQGQEEDLSTMPTPTPPPAPFAVPAAPPPPPPPTSAPTTAPTSAPPTPTQA